MSISTLSQFERGAIYQLLKDGNSHNEIARRMKLSKSTISNELSRVDPYDPVLAQEHADKMRRHCGRQSILSKDNAILIKQHLELTWSPEQIASELNLCFKSIYNWIYQGLIDFDSELLSDKSRRKKHKHETRGTFKVDETIETRPEEINTRKTFGHWEADTVLSSRGQSKACLATFVERKTRFVWAIKINDRTKESMNSAIKKMKSIFGENIKSITVDHGKEFSGFNDLADYYNLPVYFCHPYSPWERGTNEYFNRKLRWFFPKKTDFNSVSEDELLESLELINNRPLKILGWNTAIETFRDCVLKCSD
ncbi:IS30 family transposase [Companilactobacillus ginsenosidimutans]|uniref:Integrase n=1 Tax=Companilactobacillus ginsenosidimutans TaxID=1007676 RepID=A0A0H4QIF1_9LACO|nr:IS30 family transposase [Companilactobacillus ginsenosidimutans]AKP66795.1 integrase [Companilactobacillus ginsenosidimutans]AKP66816.1 integrase [Companilactobacillus ginsenosidimutans]AKP66996.1 integrase [Companilactobacillus ginsenosidimutans]